MAQPIATLLIEMAADVARLRSDMGQAQKTVGDAMKGIEATVDGAKRAFGLLAGAIGVASFTSLIKGSIDAADKLDEMAERTGVSASELSRLELAFKLAGVGSDEMQKTLVKLSSTMNTNSKAIEQLGVSTKNADGTLRGTSQVLRDVADRFASMDNGARKTALAVEIFGKSGADIIPVLNMGSKGLDEMAKLTEQLGMAMTDEGAAAAEQFNDTLDFLKTAVAGVARQATADLLPSLTNMATALLKTATETDLLKRAGELLGVVLKSLFTVVMSVAEALSSVATIATATWQAFMAATRGDFSAAVDIIKKAGSDVSAGWAKTSEIIKGAWNGSAEAAVSATATLLGQAKRNQDAALLTAEAQKEMEAAAKKAQAEYEKLASSLDKTTISALAEADAGGKLTDAKKLELDVRQKLNDTTLKLTASQRQEIETKLAAAMAALNDRDAQKAAEEARKKLLETIGKQNEDLVKQIEAQKKANEESGLSREEIRRLEIQRLREAAATAEQTVQLRIQSGINDETTEQYRKQAENLRKLADEKEKGIHVEAAKEARDAWAETTESIYDGLTDALMRAFESGKGFMDAFKQVLKNAFKTLVLEPTIRAVMAPLAGAIGGFMGGAPGVAGASTGGGGSGLLGNIGTIAGVGGVFGSAITGGLASYLGGASAVGGLTAGGFSALGSSIAAGSLSGIAASLGTLVGTLGPIALGVALLVKGFSRGPKQTTATGIEGIIGGGEVDARQFADWIKKGGWFRSDKRGTDFSTLSEETAASLNQTAAAVFNQSKMFVEAIGLSADSLRDVNTRIRVQLGKDEAENAKAIEAAFAQYREDLALSLGDALLPFQKAGETLSATLERLAAISTFSTDINALGGIFSRVAQLSISAKEELIGFAGGIEAFLQKTKAFIQNYYSQEEQFALQAKQIKAALGELGITQNVSTREDFRRIVEAVDVTTTEGRKQLDALLSLAQAFAPVGTYLEEQGKTLDELIKAAPQVAVLKSILEDTEAQTKWQEEAGERDRDFYDWYRENWADYAQTFNQGYTADTEYYAWAMANAEKTAEVEQKQLEVTERLNTGIDSFVATIQATNDALRSELSSLRASLESGLAQVAVNTRDTNRLLDSWDDNGALLTTPAPP